MRVTIEVLKEDIRRGEPGSCSTCAVSRAVRRTLKKLNPRLKLDEDSVGSDGDVAIYVAGECYWVIPLSKRMRRWIERFDALPKNQSRPTRFSALLPAAILTEGQVD